MSMRPSAAGTDSTLELASQPRADAGRREADEPALGPDGAAAEHGGPAANGNNTRSFRFLLTLALRKAQTAVTLDNGGHVDEAIRTYREAISMLGLVLNRTSEEDGRQRLLHFRQTYSDRVSVLSSLRPSASNGMLDTSLNDASPQQGPDIVASDHHQPVPQDEPNMEPHQQQQQQQEQRGTEGTRALEPARADIQETTSERPGATETNRSGQADSSDHELPLAVAASPLPIPDTTVGSMENDTDTYQALASPSFGHGPGLSVDQQGATAPASQGEANDPPQVCIREPAPSPQDRPQGAKPPRKHSMASNRSVALSSGGESARHADGAVTSNDVCLPAAVDKTSVDQDRRSEDVSDTPGAASSTKKALKTKLRSKDAEKANRRQSIKSQRSLPAMFGLGHKSRGDGRGGPAPPVPPIPGGEVPAPKLGRRLFGALRSNQASEPQTGKAGGSRGNSEDIARSSAPRSDSPMLTPQPDKLADRMHVGNHSHGSSVDRRPSAMAPDDVPASEQQLAMKQFPETDDVPPPTPSKDSPPLPTKSMTLTREQKRQSNAAHRLAGLFKRKPSIPDIPSPALPPKYSADANKATAVPTHSPQPGHVLSRDRRLSASASTPNLFEAAAAAANSDHPAMAVFAATERGVLPPMPAPPNLRPSMSATGHLPSGSVDESVDVEVYAGEREPGAPGRPGRGGSVSDAASMKSSKTTRFEEQKPRRKQQQQQGPGPRPALRIATKSASEFLTFVPEDAPLPSAPLTAGFDDGSRSRKSSVATIASHLLPRGSNGAIYGVPFNAASGPGASLANLSGRPTLGDVEEDQRAEMFEPSFGTFHPDLGSAPPKSSPLSALWFINTLHRSMVSGGAYLTTSMFIPRRLWYQSGIRIAAIDSKLTVISQLTQAFATIGSQLELPTLDALTASAAWWHDEGRAETVPWESEEPPHGSSPEKDELHNSCVALHHWLNNLEETLENSRRLLSKKLKFVNVQVASGSATAGMPPVPPSMPAALATSSNENLQSPSHLPFVPPYLGSHDGSNMANASFPNLALSTADVSNSSNGAPVSPLSPGGDPLLDLRLSDAQVPETPISAVPNGMSSSANLSRNMLGKDQMGNARFKGLGKLGKSVDRLYSNMQKEKLDDTSAYVAALQRLFEAAMALEDILHYFSRIASDAEMTGWFADTPQSPISMAGKHHPHHGRGDSGSADASSPSVPHATLVSEPSMSSLNSAAERKSSNASISVASTATDKKVRRRSNYFGQRPGGGSSVVEGAETLPASRLPPRPRGESVSVIPRLVPQMPGPSTAAATGSTAPRFVLAQSPIKNPLSYVNQGKGRAPGVIYARLVRVMEWLNQVLVAWVVRDLQVLYAKYIKRLREWVVE
ncbi:hypothetical protein GGF46_000213 [Coemansia sp. RSA 552]|nr:hypothetical protein GGF46_000213 [Coemansia sp. RSA 552]